MSGSVDILIVGAGLTAATLCAKLKAHHRILVVDTRDHLGGNCYDYPSQGTMIHHYGPHIFHTSSDRIVEFLSDYTAWKPCRYSVTGEIEDGGQLKQVPFPCSEQTERALGRQLNPDEIINLFFRGYTKKMWGKDWEDMPASVRNRVPKHSKKTSDYFPGQFQAQPQHGFTRMIENMLDGVDVILGESPDAWYRIAAKKVIYCGRPDHIRDGRGQIIAQNQGLLLPYRSLHITKHSEPWELDTVGLNFCHSRTSRTRHVCYRMLTGGRSSVVSHEVPYEADPDDTAPYYPKSEPEYRHRYEQLAREIRTHHPGLVLAGRMGTYMYYDMDQCVGHGLALAEKVLKGED